MNPLWAAARQLGSMQHYQLMHSWAQQMCAAGSGCDSACGPHSHLLAMHVDKSVLSLVVLLLLLLLPAGCGQATHGCHQRSVMAQ